MKTTIFEQSVDIGAAGANYGVLFNLQATLSTRGVRIKRIRQIINQSCTSDSVWEEPRIATTFNFGVQRPFVGCVQISGTGIDTGLAMGIDSIKELNLDLVLAGGQNFTLTSNFHLFVNTYVDDITITQYVIVDWEEL